MNTELDAVLHSIGEEYKGHVRKGARHYMEVSIGERAEKMGFAELGEKYKTTFAVVPLKAPRRGMKVRIDGRTFVDYAQDEVGIALPGYLARETGRTFTAFVANDSMICNFA
jgi:hypothetical protein